MDRTQRPDDSDSDRSSRERYWRRKLGRIRLGAEPVEVQLDRYYRVTLLLTVIPGLLGCAFVALFAAFRRPDVGAVLATVLLAPIVTFAWIDYAVLRTRVRAYLQEANDRAPTQQS